MRETAPVPPSPPVLCDDGQFLAAAGEWAPGDPFPVLTGPPLDRYRLLFAAGRLPDVERQRLPGVVISTDTPVSRAAGRLLAAATTRRHLPVSAARLLEEVSAAARGPTPVAVVGLAGDFAAAGQWPGRAGSRVGVVSARSPAALSCLVYRSLTTAAAADDRVHFVSHPLLTDAESADATDFEALTAPRAGRIDLLVLRASGRECCAGLPDGVVCGRSGPIEPLAAPGERFTTCMRGEGCFRSDLDESRRLPAAELNAALVFAQSCTAVTLGANAYPTEVSLGLGFLDGTAVAVIGALGVHLDHPGARLELAAALAARLALGAVVERLNTGGVRGELTRFGLLGDPALVLPVPAPRPARSPPARAGPAPGPPLKTLHRITTRLEELLWLDLRVDEERLTAVRSSLRRITRSASATSTVEVAAELDDLQHEVLANTAERIYRSGWNFGESSGADLRQVGRTDVRCPGCARPTAVLLRLAHRVVREIAISTLQCRRCGDIWWSTGGDALEVRGRTDLAGDRARPLLIRRRVVNHRDEPVSGSVALAFRARRALNFPPPWTARTTLPPRGGRRFEVPVALTPPLPRADTHTGVFCCLVSGIHIASFLMVGLH